MLVLLVLTFAPYASGSTLCILVMVVTGCNVHCWCFFIQPLAQIVHLHM